MSADHPRPGLDMGKQHIKMQVWFSREGLYSESQEKEKVLNVEEKGSHFQWSRVHGKDETRRQEFEDSPGIPYGLPAAQPSPPSSSHVS